MDLLELALGVGVERVARLGGLAAYTGWRGRALAIARLAPDSPGAASGWRAPDAARVVGRGPGWLRVRSGVDGSIRTVRQSEMEAWAARLGLEGPLLALEAGDTEPALWDDPAAAAPAAGLVVTDLPRRMAAAGRFAAPPVGQATTATAGVMAWTDLAGLPPPAPGRPGGGGPLVAGCECPACGIASAGLIRHLWEQREITATHLLLRHNLHLTARLLV